MKRVVLLLFCSLFTLSVAFAQDAKKKSNKETVTFVVDGMDCANCVKKIEKNIAFEKGVTDLVCDLPTKTAKITYRSDKTNEGNLTAAFKKIGMEATSAEEDSDASSAKKNEHQHDH